MIRRVDAVEHIMKVFDRVVLASAVVVLAQVAADAHFRLLEPASWLIEDERGDPQKGGPCGGTNTNWGTPSYAIGKATGGQKLHIKVQETIYHPGHYRVALAVNSPTELPLDPKTEVRDTERGPWSVSAEIQNPVQIPVLADGLFVHSTRPTGAMPPWEADVQLPNINCRKCTLQVVQFMAEHAFNNPGGYSYHHCAALQITADSSKPIDRGWPSER
ncbi:MAG TPA: SCE4755 family polysaccharide monooxygenase-like protein [Vicinamibacterales bacterium]|nr:SCE4755 family polysaccharide monooxygenase-like protein [Vicinamibacterales bacterium]